MKATLLVVTSRVFDMNSPGGYVIGAVIALSILVYLVYSLIKPEKF